MGIVEAVLVTGGRFLKPLSPGGEGTGWMVVAIETARQKVAHLLQYHQRRLAFQKQEEEESRSSSPSTCNWIADGV
jgi:hypothetical protein